MNIAKNLERARIFFPEKPALIFEGKTWSYLQLDTDVNRMANGLRELGVSKGDRVALFLPNIPEFVKELPKSPTGKIRKRVLRGDP